jgi:hypothetical protein
MSRIDTTSFAQLLAGGMGQGVSLGQNLDAQRFAQGRAAASDANTAFQQGLQLDDRAMRRMMIEQAAADRVAEFEARDRKRKADQTILSAMQGDDATFSAAMPGMMPMLADASPDIQRGLTNRNQFLRDVQKGQAQLDSLRQMGAKLDIDNIKRFESLGLTVPPDMRPKSLREQSDADDQQDREALTIWGMSQGMITPEEAKAVQGFASPTMMRDAIMQAGAAKRAAAQAAQDQQSTQALQQPLARYRSGQATEADLLALKQGGLITASQIEPNKPMENPLVFAEKQAERVDGEIQRIEQELLNQGVATKEKGAFLLNKDKVKDGDGTGWFDGDATPEYARRQELLKQRDALMKQREAIGSALVKQQLGPIIAQLEAQLGRKPTREEVRAALGAPRSTQAIPAQAMPQQPQ